jgi:hypothetical protein
MPFLEGRSIGQSASAPGSSIPNLTGGGPGMHSVFYIIGVVVVVLAILSLLGLT